MGLCCIYYYYLCNNLIQRLANLLLDICCHRHTVCRTHIHDKLYTHYCHSICKCICCWYSTFQCDSCVFDSIVVILLFSNGWISDEITFIGADDQSMYLCSPIKWLLHCKSSFLFLNDLETSNTIKHPITYLIDKLYILWFERKRFYNLHRKMWKMWKMWHLRMNVNKFPKCEGATTLLLIV